MNRLLYKIVTVLLAAVLISSAFGVTALADELRAGTVAGLPEKLVVLDDKGNSVSENGEYYFQVEGMKASEHYTKKIQIMNLREDASYHIDFRAQKISSQGEIDLENECHCVITLDDQVIYEGKVTGEGTPDMRIDPLDLGYYVPGQSRTMKVDIVWNDSGTQGSLIDYGKKIVDYNGVTVIREKFGRSHIEGEVIFKWIFTAAVGIPPEPEYSDPDNSNPSVPSTPGTPIDTGETIVLVLFCLAALGTAVMMFLLFTRKKKKEQTKKQE